MAVNNKIYNIEIEYHEHIPKDLKNGVLYISNKFKTAIHLCACGCGGQTVTPFKRWKLTYDNGKVTLMPSIGNWSGQSPHHAHYYITNNKIIWLK